FIPPEDQRLMLSRPQSRIVFTQAGRRQSGRLSKAWSAVSAVAAWSTSPGTQSGNGVSILRCAPEAVCTSSIEASLVAGIGSLLRPGAAFSPQNEAGLVAGI